MGYRKWNWKHKNWPHFSFNSEVLKNLEFQFSQNTGTVSGVLKHVKEKEKENFIIEILNEEALKTSEIEGEYLNRASIKSSIKKNLGLKVDTKKASLAEQGISEMMVDLYLNYEKKLTHQQLFEWHTMLAKGRTDLIDIGRYRTHKEPMQIVSERLDKPSTHFEAPPSEQMQLEMERFVTWFNFHHFDKKQELSPLAKAGITHLYFVSIHPFEDGNGRVGRALVEKSISLSTEKPALISLSQTIESHKKEYYTFLENHNTTLKITDWLFYFSKTILKSQEETIKLVDFIVKKAHFFNRFTVQLKERQLKVIQRVFKSGHRGFKGGLSSDNYVRIAKTSASTATRDLKDLVKKGVLVKTGVLKGTRYYLNLSNN